jgi:hypothetical protein
MKEFQTFARSMDYETFVDNNMAEPIITIGHSSHNEDGEFIPDVSFWANGTVSFGTTYGFGSILSAYPNSYRFPFAVMSVILSIYNNSPDKETFEALQYTFYDAWFRSLPDSICNDNVGEIELGQCPISKDGVDTKRLGEICEPSKQYTPIMEIEIGGATFFISMNGYITPYTRSTITFGEMKRLIHISENVADIMHYSVYPFNRDVKEISVEEFEKLFSE